MKCLFSLLSLSLRLSHSFLFIPSSFFSSLLFFFSFPHLHSFLLSSHRLSFLSSLLFPSLLFLSLFFFLSRLTVSLHFPSSFPPFSSSHSTPLYPYSIYLIHKLTASRFPSRADFKNFSSSQPLTHIPTRYTYIHTHIYINYIYTPKLESKIASFRLTKRSKFAFKREQVRF